VLPTDQLFGASVELLLFTGCHVLCSSADVLRQHDERSDNRDGKRHHSPAASGRRAGSCAVNLI